MDNEQPHQELVKCVVVGDTAVGKTRLICARACNKQVSLSQLLTTHVPTVWAIDQYRIYKDVLERSWEVVDSVNVSLRLWDTFGDHEKDRRFAYGRSDVVLLCFSINSPVSLRNCKLMWYPEIRRFCPQTPVLLVGCKNDLRYMYRDETYLSYFRERSPFVRATRKDDLVMPDEARTVARELGVYYYETSVLTYYGVNEVFENAIRVALMARRQQRFWMTNLKKVQRPLLQSPFMPPKPTAPEVVVSSSNYREHLRQLLLEQLHADLVLVAGPISFAVHRFVLAAASTAFNRVLAEVEREWQAVATKMASQTVNQYQNPNQLQQPTSQRSSSDSSVASSTFGEATVGEFNEDTEHLIRAASEASHRSRMWEQLRRRASCQTLVECRTNNDSNSRQQLSQHERIDRDHRDVLQLRNNERTNKNSQNESVRQTAIVNRDLNHPAFQSIRMEQAPRQQRRGPRAHTVVTLTKLVTPHAIQQCLNFLYTGMIDQRCLELQEMLQAAEFLELPHLLALLSRAQPGAAESAASTAQVTCDAHIAQLKSWLLQLCVEQGSYSDVTFELDDGRCRAHRPMLMARCEMMNAMFSGDFRESHASAIQFPGVRTYTFHKLLCYIYGDELPPVSAGKCLNLLELANRLCLPRLVHLVERRVIEDLTRVAQSEPNEAVEQCLRLLEPVKLHNAHQLADWCMNHLCCNYNRLCRASPRSLRLLHPENQEYLSENRWPPVWYLKDYDYYQKCIRERQEGGGAGGTLSSSGGGTPSDCPPRGSGAQLKRAGSDAGSGCLCFSGGKSRKNVQRSTTPSNTPNTSSHDNQNGVQNVNVAQAPPPFDDEILHPL